MKSDKALHYIGRYFSLLLAAGWILYALDKSQVAGGQLTQFASAMAAMAGSFCLVSFFQLYNKFKIVELTPAGISLTGTKTHSPIPWEKIQSIRKYPLFVNVPYYRAKLVGSGDFIVFGTPKKFWDVADQNLSIEELNRFIENKRIE